MKILFIADGRSATTRSWIRGLKPFNHDIHLISTYPCSEIEEVNSITFLPLAFSGVGRKPQDKQIVQGAAYFPSKKINGRPDHFAFQESVFGCAIHTWTTKFAFHSQKV